MKLQQSAVKKYAVENNIPVLQPEKLKSPEFLDELRSYHADVQVVVAFRMLPEVVWNMPPLGTINVHASLLPNYRGAAPINWAIINGEKETGVTTFKLQHEIDTGHILLQSTLGITEQDTAGTLHDKLMTAGAALIVDTLHQVEKGHVAEKPQIVLHDYKHAPKLFTETCLIDWNHTTEHVYNLIRGLSPYPAAFTIVNDKKMKLFLCSKIIHTHQLQPGTLLSDNKHSIRFACTDGFIEVNELQLEGKTRMKTDDFLRGNKIV